MSTAPLGYATTRWPGEDGGPRRLQSASSTASLRCGPSEHYETTSRLAIATTMVVWGKDDDLYLLTHGVGGSASAVVERIDPVSLETLERSEELDGGLIWPGGIAAHRNGDLYVVFGNHAHRIDQRCNRIASVTLPREAPYNSFVIIDSGHLVTKDFGGRLPNGTTFDDATELCVLNPTDCSILTTFTLPEGSIARLSASGQRIVVVGTHHLFVLHVDAQTGEITEQRRTRYRTMEGQGYGWDPVISDNIAWFMDNGEGSEAFDGSLLDKGIASVPLHLISVNLEDGELAMVDVAGLTGGLIANPPLVDERRQLVVGYDSSNAVVSCFAIGEDHTLTKRWSRAQAHASHLLLFDERGELVTFDFTPGGTDAFVLLDIETGDELGRTSTNSPIQSVVFPAPGKNRDLYYCSLAMVSRIAVVPDVDD